MMRKYLLYFSLICAMFAGRAFAEGNCPAGMYPIGGQGVMGCAPIPRSSPRVKARPELIWIAKWGAVVSSDIDVVGLSTGFADERGAVQAALEQCRERGGRNCKLDMAYNNTCVAAAIPSRNGVPLGGQAWLQTGLDLDAIKAAAVDLCSKSNRKSCEVAYTNCALP